MVRERMVWSKIGPNAWPRDGGIAVVATHCRSVIVLATVAWLTAACESPVAYRPELEGFQKATEQTALLMEAQRRKVTDLRAALRHEVLQDRKPFIKLSGGCMIAIQKLSQSIATSAPTPLDPASIDECRLVLPNDSDIEQLFNPQEVMAHSAAFAASVAAYAVALNEVATTGDQEEFVRAVEGLGGAATSLATSAAKAAGKQAPSLEDLSPIATVVGNAGFYFLENRRAEALKDAARAAQRWIEDGSQGVVRVLYAQRFEEITVANQQLFERLDAVNEANADSYPDEADKAIRALSELKGLLAGDPGASFRKLPEAHRKLIDAFDDRKRHLQGAIAAAQDLFESARAAHAAITEK